MNSADDAFASSLLGKLSAEIRTLREALEHYACPEDCWAKGISGPNPLIGPPNTQFCHNDMRGRECDLIARQALDHQDEYSGNEDKK